MNNIFVGNLSFEATKEDVQKLFESYGVVSGVSIVKGKKGKSRGFGFVDMPNEEQKDKAIAALKGQEHMGRELLVTVVIPKVKSEFKSNMDSRYEKRDKSHRSYEDRPTGNQGYEEKGYRARNDRESRPWSKDEGTSRAHYKKFDSLSKSIDNPRHADRPVRDSRYEGKTYRRDDKQARPWNKDSRDPRAHYKKFDSFSKSSDTPRGEGGSAGNSRYESKTYRPDDRQARPERRGDSNAPRAEGRATGNSRYEGKPYRRQDRESKPWSKARGSSSLSYNKFSKSDENPRQERRGNDNYKDEKRSSSKPAGAFKMFYKTGKVPKPWPKKGETTRSSQ